MHTCLSVHKPTPGHWTRDLCFPIVAFFLSSFFLFWSQRAAATNPPTLIRIDETPGSVGSLWLQSLGRSSVETVSFLRMLEIPRNPLTERRFRRAVFLFLCLFKEKQHKYRRQNESGHHIASFNKEAPFIRRSYPLGCRSISVQSLPSTYTSEHSHERMLAIFNWQKCLGENLNTFYYLIIARAPNSQIREASAS